MLQFPDAATRGVPWKKMFLVYNFVKKRDSDFSSLIKNRHRCLPMNFAKFLRISILKNNYARLLLNFIALISLHEEHLSVNCNGNRIPRRKTKIKLSQYWIHSLVGPHTFFTLLRNASRNFAKIKNTSGDCFLSFKNYVTKNFWTLIYCNLQLNK